MKYLKSAYQVAVVTALAGTTGCLSMHGNPTLDAVNAALGVSQPYVEAYLEFPGPQERWAGPMSLVVHVRAKQGAPLEVLVTPHSFQAPLHPTLLPSALAQGTDTGSKDPQRSPAAAATMSSEEARERLGMLATALQSGDTEFRGCASPVRVRLIRADGGVAR